MSDASTRPTGGKRTAGAFDVRSIIGALLGVYGVILFLMGLLGGADTDKAGVNSNLWAGLALLAVSAVFLAWWRLRPIVVPDADEKGDGGPPRGH